MQVDIQILQTEEQEHQVLLLDHQFQERFIKFYYNPKHITQVQIRSANIRELQQQD